MIGLGEEFTACQGEPMQEGTLTSFTLYYHYRSFAGHSQQL